MKKIYTSKFFSFIAGDTAVKTFICEYLRELSKIFEMVLMGYSEARGKLIFERNLKLKISYQTTFNYSTVHVCM